MHRSGAENERDNSKCFRYAMIGRCRPGKGPERLIIKSSRYSSVEIGDKATALATRLRGYFRALKPWVAGIEMMHVMNTRRNAMA